MTGDQPALAADVVVVGAGISGLATARHLSQHELTIRVLEARDRVGGRLDSVDGLDTGATWFWPNEPLVRELIAELDVSVHHQYLDGNAMYQDASGVQQVDGNPLDVSSGRFVRGADSLARAVAAELDPATVVLGSVVERIQQAGELLDVVSTTGTLRCRHVVLALPPALAASSITFSPPLPDDLQRLAAATPVWMGSTTKVVIRYAEAFWRQRGLSGSAMSHVGPIRELHDMSGPDGVPAALFGFIAPRAVGSPTATEHEVVDQLVTIFGSEAANPEQVAIRDWRHERFTSPPQVERLNAYETYGHPLFQQPALNDRLHWASTETAVSFAGHIEGALAAAERATHAITTHHQW